MYPLSQASCAILALTTEEKRSAITPEILSRRWHIGVATAKRTLLVTTQAGVRNVLVPADRRTRQRLNHLKYPTLWVDLYTDTLFSTKVPSIRKCTAAQVFTNGRGYDRFYPIRSKAFAPESLMSFIQDVGIPKTIISDNAWE